MSIGLIEINIYAKYLNFECQLHAMAFQKFLEQHGYNSRFLNYNPVYYGNFDMRDPSISYEAALRKLGNKMRDGKSLTPGEETNLKKYRAFANGFRELAKERGRRYDKFRRFAKQNLVMTDEVYTSDRLEVLIAI